MVIPTGVESESGVQALRFVRGDCHPMPGPADENPASCLGVGSGSGRRTRSGGAGGSGHQSRQRESNLLLDTETASISRTRRSQSPLNHILVANLHVPTLAPQEVTQVVGQPFRLEAIEVIPNHDGHVLGSLCNEVLQQVVPVVLRVRVRQKLSQALRRLLGQRDWSVAHCTVGCGSFSVIE